MALAEGTIGASSIDLISTDRFWAMTMTAAMCPCLCLQVFPFVVGVVTQAIEEGESLAGDRD
jgi:hypothetical protein